MRSGRTRLRDIPIPTFEPRPAVASAIDWTFFIVGGVGAVWLAYLLFTESFSLGWGVILAIIVFWVLLAYLVLPRLHRILTRIYVPDYFIGRARTSDGLLGDPVNLALLGTEPQVHEAMTSAGWIRADDLSFRSGMHIVSSTLSRRSYLEAPVSPLLLFGRQQDFAYQQEVDGSPGKRHHVRFVNMAVPTGQGYPSSCHESASMIHTDFFASTMRFLGLMSPNRMLSEWRYATFSRNEIQTSTRSAFVQFG